MSGPRRILLKKPACPGSQVSAMDRSGFQDRSCNIIPSVDPVELFLHHVYDIFLCPAMEIQCKDLHVILQIRTSRTEPHTLQNKYPSVECAIRTSAECTSSIVTHSCLKAFPLYEQGLFVSVREPNCGSRLESGTGMEPK